jgi:hypothetical protein
VKDGITKWIHGWKRNGWKTADKKPVKNAELWQRLDAARKPHTSRWHWVKGHAGHAENERADALAPLALLVHHEVEALALAVAGIVAFGQAPDLRLARAAEGEQARHLAGRALLDRGDPEGDLAANLDHARRDPLDDPRRWKPSRPRSRARHCRGGP